jgi:hypothetical protein
MATGVWPWLSGPRQGSTFMQVAAHLVGFGTALVSWKYLKQANYGAAEALQEAIDAEEVYA